MIIQEQLAHLIASHATSPALASQESELDQLNCYTQTKKRQCHIKQLNCENQVLLLINN